MKPPEFGKDLEPSDDMIARGRFGNGSYQLDEQGPSLELVRAEKKRLAIKRKEDRRAEYEAKVVEDLSNIADLQSALIKAGKKIAIRATRPDAEISKAELEILAKSLKAAEQVSNRAMGLASRLDDKAPKQDGLSFLIEGEEVGE